MRSGTKKAEKRMGNDAKKEKGKNGLKKRSHAESFKKNEVKNEKQFYEVQPHQLRDH